MSQSVVRGAATLGGALGFLAVLTGSTFAQTGQDGDASITIMAIVFVLAAIIYFIPSFVAFRRRHPNRWVILVINIVFGGTGIGWLGSFVWACGAVHKSDTGSNGGESGLNIFANDPVRVQVEGDGRSLAIPSDPAARLQQLKALLDTGVLSAEEYDQLRKPVLAALQSGLGGKAAG